MKKVVLKFGFIGGAFLVAMIFVMRLIMGDSNDFSKGEGAGYIFMIGGFSMVFWAIREYRDKLNNGYINFNTGFRVGILVSLVASLCYVAGWMIYFYFIETSFVEKYTAYYFKVIESGGFTPAEIAKQKQDFSLSMEQYKNPFVMMLYTLLKVFPLGLIVTILCSMLMKRTEK